MCDPQSYETLCRDFSWDACARDFGVGGSEHVNITQQALDRHVDAGHGERIALVALAKSGAVRRYSYRDLLEQSARFADALTHTSIDKGARVFTLLGRVPELYITALGAWRCGAVFSPLFSAFGPEPVQARMSIGEANVLVTTAALYKRKVEPWREQLPSLKLVLIVGDTSSDVPVDTINFTTFIAQARADTPVAETAAEDLALLHFTSGTTGQPKGVMHVHQAVVAHHITGQMALDMHADDVYWCTADPGWVTGTSYGIIAPLTNGVTLIVDEAEFDAVRWYQILQNYKVSVWYTAPTAIRLLMKAGEALVSETDLSSLRFLASVGEPLNPEAVVWSQAVYGRPLHDNWWQTETGGIMIANFPRMPIKPGSMGKPVPGVTAAVVERKPNGQVQPLRQANTVGEIALREGWPSMMRGYFKDEARYRACFVDGWYLTGDLARVDEEGYFWFVGRTDDVIKSAGHLIGPFEVESTLIAHPAVVEAAVVGLPDATAGEIVKAFVTVHEDYEPTDVLRRELLGFARKKLGPAVAPRAIAFRDVLPKTRSGKIMRRLLKARELGLPEGDTSSLETQ